MVKNNKIAIILGLLGLGITSFFISVLVGVMTTLFFIVGIFLHYRFENHKYFFMLKMIVAGVSFLGAFLIMQYNANIHIYYILISIFFAVGLNSLLHYKGSKNEK